MTKKQIYENIIHKYNDINFYIFENNYSLAFPESKTIFVGTDISHINSNDSIFTLLHEIGHIYNDNDDRSCVREYIATIWAIKNIKEYNLDINNIEKNEWQNYIYIRRDKDINNGYNVPNKNDLILWR